MLICALNLFTYRLVAENRFATFPWRRKAVYTEVFLNSVPTIPVHVLLHAYVLCYELFNKIAGDNPWLPFCLFCLGISSPRLLKIYIRGEGGIMRKSCRHLAHTHRSSLFISPTGYLCSIFPLAIGLSLSCLPNLSAFCPGL